MPRQVEEEEHRDVRLVESRSDSSVFRDRWHTQHLRLRLSLDPPMTSSTCGLPKKIRSQTIDFQHHALAIERHVNYNWRLIVYCLN